MLGSFWLPLVGVWSDTSCSTHTCQQETNRPGSQKCPRVQCPQTRKHRTKQGILISATQTTHAIARNSAAAARNSCGIAQHGCEVLFLLLHFPYLGRALDKTAEVLSCQGARRSGGGCPMRTFGSFLRSSRGASLSVKRCQANSHMWHVPQPCKGAASYPRCQHGALNSWFRPEASPAHLQITDLRFLRFQWPSAARRHAAQSFMDISKAEGNAPSTARRVCELLGASTQPCHIARSNVHGLPSSDCIQLVLQVKLFLLHSWV